MNLIVWLTATGLTIRFVYTFLYLFFNRHTLHEHEVVIRHRDPEDRRRKHFSPINIDEIVSTGEIYSERRPVSKMGVF